MAQLTGTDYDVSGITLVIINTLFIFMKHEMSTRSEDPKKLANCQIDIDIVSQRFHGVCSVKPVSWETQTFIVHVKDFHQILTEWLRTVQFKSTIRTEYNSASRRSNRPMLYPTKFVWDFASNCSGADYSTEDLAVTS